MPTNPDIQGCIDVWGYAAATGSWLLGGWVPWTDGVPPQGFLTVSLRFAPEDGGDGGEVSGDALVVATSRADLFGRGVGILLHLPASGLRSGALLSATLHLPGDAAGPAPRMQSIPDTQRLSDRVLSDTLARSLPGQVGEWADRLSEVLARRGFEQQDTLDRLGDRCAFRIDEAIRCGENGVLLDGWLVAAPSGVRAVRLRCGLRSTRLSIGNAAAVGGMRVARPDVLDKYGRALGSHDVRCGFVLFEPHGFEPGCVPFFEIEATGGEVAYARLHWSRLRGLPAIRHALGHLSPRYNDVPRCFDLLGPAIEQLNLARLEPERGYREMMFGAAPAQPRCSVIVPLYGRVDYLEVQVAFLAGGGFAHRHELIYVVDDPEIADAAVHLADTVFRRFGVPIRLLLLDENHGFAPACNAGLGIAAGEAVCFLNSDVFGLEPDWLDRLLSRLDEAELVGPLLLFEDDTVQHGGMGFETVPELGGWWFPTHPGKGSRPDGAAGLSFHPAITGACMVMRRALALELDGFDENFVIGDFEDSDLCLRAAERGARCAVDAGVALYHLERKSQASHEHGWRMNLTLFNAWLHQRRWGARLDVLCDADPVPGALEAVS
ncbi:glycosyltransferase family 2 protein [Rhizosaccharibacter radicis]|uniref:Glycosyltransferase family 2 protein n=1 Tax=Rhizosaccharibacter radicis TaxID=2782605 RepID=A0ABT1VT58_9PROT|nr:glycosyltransferase family 2 protein [Acetobacteraceae bacterium KSS12]